MKKERATMSDEQRERMLIAEQIERAAAEGQSKTSEEDSEKSAVEEGLKRDEISEKVVLSFSTKPAAAQLPSEVSTVPTMPSLKMNPLKLNASNPLKRPNVFKAASSNKLEKDQGEIAKVNGKRRDAPMSAAERLIYEDQERKRRKMEREHDRT